MAMARAPGSISRNSTAARLSGVRTGRIVVASLGGLSKSCGLPQLKLSWIAVSGMTWNRLRPPHRREGNRLRRIQGVNTAGHCIPLA